MYKTGTLPFIPSREGNFKKTKTQELGRLNVGVLYGAF